jgi:hypothetical protein
VREQYPRLRALISRQILDMFFEKGQEHWRSRLETRLRELTPAGRDPSVPIEIVANHLAGTMFNTLKWWLNNKTPYPPERMDEIVQELVMPSVRATLGIGRL